MVRVVVDAMGGDDAPLVTVKGAVEAVNEAENISITLVGRTDDVKRELDKYTYDESRINIVHADDVIGFDEPPVMAIRKKKNSSPMDTEYHIFRQCPYCSATLRLPRQKGKHTVKCPRCSKSFGV